MTNGFRELGYGIGRQLYYRQHPEMRPENLYLQQLAREAGGRYAPELAQREKRGQEAQRLLRQYRTVPPTAYTPPMPTKPDIVAKLKQAGQEMGRPPDKLEVGDKELGVKGSWTAPKEEVQKVGGLPFAFTPSPDVKQRQLEATKEEIKVNAILKAQRDGIESLAPWERDVLIGVTPTRPVRPTRFAQEQRIAKSNFVNFLNLKYYTDAAGNKVDIKTQGDAFTLATMMGLDTNDPGVKKAIKKYPVGKVTKKWLRPETIEGVASPYGGRDPLGIR